MIPGTFATHRRGSEASPKRGGGNVKTSIHRVTLGVTLLAAMTASASTALGQEQREQPRQGRGERLYLQYCASCHQPNGKGIPGFFPPLAGNQSVTTEDRDEIQEFLRTIIFGHHGELEVEGEVYVGTMPPIGFWGRVNDSEILALVNYQRNAWGNRARPISAQELARAREAASEEETQKEP